MAPTRGAVGFRSRKRHSFSRKRKRAAGALRIPPLRPSARSLARLHARSLVGLIDRDSRVPAGRSGEDLIRLHVPLTVGIHGGFCVPPRFPPVPRVSLSSIFRPSSRGRPRNITRSRHSFFTVDRRRGPRDNNGGEERFATAITLTATGREVEEEDTPPSLPAPPFVFHSVPLARSPRGWQKRVGLAG